MIKFILVSLALMGSAFAQNMAPTEDYRSVYTERDGAYVYIGGCSLHEDYLDVYFKVTGVVQKYFSPDDLTRAEVANILAKFEKEAIKALLQTFQMYDVGPAQEDELDIFMNYVDDLEVELVSHKTIPGLDLIRFNMGVGGGNGGYAIFNRVVKNGKPVYEKLSYTFDGDLEYCDKKIWLKK